MAPLLKGKPRQGLRAVVHRPPGSIRIQSSHLGPLTSRGPVSPPATDDKLTGPCKDSGRPQGGRSAPAGAVCRSLQLHPRCRGLSSRPSGWGGGVEALRSGESQEGCWVPQARLSGEPTWFLRANMQWHKSTPNSSSSRREGLLLLRHPCRGEWSASRERALFHAHPATHTPGPSVTQGPGPQTRRKHSAVGFT